MAETGQEASARPWLQWGLAGVAVLLVGGFIGWLIAGGSGGGTKTVTVSTGSTVKTSTSQTQTTPVAGGAGSATHEQTVAVSGSQTPGIAFNGDGNAALGAIAVQGDSTLRWKCSGTCDPFEITSAKRDDPRLSVSGKGAEGSDKVKKGTYTAVRVKTDGRWSFTLAASK